MKKYLYHIFAVCIMLMPVVASAQEKQSLRQVYEKAEEAFGRYKDMMNRVYENLQIEIEEKK